MLLMLNMMYIVAKHLEYPGKPLMLAYESTHKSLLSLQIVQCLTKGMLRDTHAHTFMYTVRVSAWPVISIVRQAGTNSDQVYMRP